MQPFLAEQKSQDKLQKVEMWFHKKGEEIKTHGMNRRSKKGKSKPLHAHRRLTPRWEQDTGGNNQATSRKAKEEVKGLMHTRKSSHQKS